MIGRDLDHRGGVALEVVLIVDRLAVGGDEARHERRVALQAHDARDLGARELILEFGDLPLVERLLLLGGMIFRVFGQVAMGTRFFDRFGAQRSLASDHPEIRARIDGASVHPNLEMHMRAVRSAGRADLADDLPGRDRRADAVLPEQRGGPGEVFPEGVRVVQPGLEQPVLPHHGPGRRGQQRGLRLAQRRGRRPGDTRRRARR